MFSDHTAETIADTLHDVLSNRVLSPDNLVATTTDNGSNYVSAFNNLLKWPRVSCFGHNLDLAINKSLKANNIQRAISQCHGLVAMFSRSWKKTRDLREKQVELNLEEHKLIACIQMYHTLYALTALHNMYMSLTRARIGRWSVCVSDLCFCVCMCVCIIII